MNFIDQRILRDPARNDGHDVNGVVGDCLKTCVVNMLRYYDYDEVPHFAHYKDWWAAMRRWARSEGFDFGFGCPPYSVLKHFTSADLLIASGPSPRGDYWHAILVDGNLEMVHDPHPSRTGILSVEDLIFTIPKMELNNLPYQKELTS